MNFGGVFLKEIASILNSVIWVIVGILLLWVTYKVFEKLTPFDDWLEIQRGNTAVSVFFGCIFIAIAIIIAAVIVSM